MGNNINKNPRYNMEKYISLKIELNEKCYNPGEFIKGHIFLSPKPGITQTNFSDPSINFTISQHQYFNVVSNNNNYISQLMMF